MRTSAVYCPCMHPPNCTRARACECECVRACASADMRLSKCKRLYSLSSCVSFITHDKLDKRPGLAAGTGGPILKQS